MIPERGDEARGNDQVVVHPERLEGLAELRPQEELGGQQAGGRRQDGDRRERGGGLQRDDAPQDAEGGAGEPQEAERSLPFDEP